MLLDERIRCSPCANYIYGKDFRQYDFHITIFHLSIRLTTDKTIHGMDKRDSSLFYWLCVRAVNCYTFQQTKNANHKHGEDRMYECTMYMDSSHLGHIYLISYAWAWFKRTFMFQMMNEANEMCSVAECFGVDAINCA